MRQEPGPESDFPAMTNERPSPVFLDQIFGRRGIISPDWMNENQPVQGRANRCPLGGVFYGTRPVLTLCLSTSSFLPPSFPTPARVLSLAGISSSSTQVVRTHILLLHPFPKSVTDKKLTYRTSYSPVAMSAEKDSASDLSRQRTDLEDYELENRPPFVLSWPEVKLLGIAGVSARSF